jgi:hypothetical protein
MGRKAIPPLTEERKQYIDSGLIKRMDTSDAAYYLRVDRKTIQEKVRNDRSFADIARRYSKKGEIFFFFEQLEQWERTKCADFLYA